MLVANAAQRSPGRALSRLIRIPRAPLLLVGERGRGKTRLVEDRLAALKGGERIVTVPCGTLKPELMAWHGEAGWIDQAVSTWQAQRRRLVPKESLPGVSFDRGSPQVARQEFGGC